MKTNENQLVPIVSMGVTDPILLGIIDLATRIVLYGTATAVLFVLVGGLLYFSGLSRNLGKKAIKAAIGMFLFCTIIYFGLLGADVMPDLSTVFHIPT